MFLYGGPTAKTVLAVLERFAPTLRSFAVYGRTDLHGIVPDRMVEVLKKTKYLDTMVLGVEVPQELLLKMCAQRKFKNLHVKYSEMVVDADYFESTVSDRNEISVEEFVSRLLGRPWWLERDDQLRSRVRRMSSIFHLVSA